MTETPQDRCKRYRRRILEISQQVSAAHVAPAFSCVEIVDALYNDVMRPDDIFIMSKGHGYLSQLVVLEDLGKVSRDEMDLYCKPGGRLGGHPDYAPDLGVHASTGSLGHGLGIAAGQAYADKLKGSGARVYCLLSDGELQEGSTWEAVQVAVNLGLDNLIALVDANGWGGMQRIPEDFPALRDLGRKFLAFEWHACEANDGHSHSVLLESLRMMDEEVGAPKCVVCRTVKGRGVSFIEQGQPLWHYKSPSEAEYERALEELS